MPEKYHFSTTAYSTVKTQLQKALEQVLAAGHSVGEFTELTLDKFGDTYTPHLRQFLGDVGRGEIKIKGLTKSAKKAIVGQHLSLEEREALIREAAYFRAEKRGFAPGFETDDWAAAEREVDTRLAQEAGLIEKGQKLLAAGANNAEQEFTNLKTLVRSWLDEKYGAVNEKAPGKKAAANKTAKKKTIKQKAMKKEATKKKITAKKKSDKKSKQSE